MNFDFDLWWIYLICNLVFILLVFLVVKWRHETLVQEKKALEKAFKERTKELYHKDLQLEHMEQQNLLLREESNKLKETSRMKSRFFADISHEFRTPLTLILGLLEDIRFNSQDKKTEKKIKVILRNSQQLHIQINQLLDLSKFDNGKMKLNAARQNIIPFLRGIMESFYFFARQNQLDLTFTPEEENMMLYFDAEKLEKVMVNLIANAVKFTTPGGKIKVTAASSQCQEFFNISIADTGVGIPHHQLPYIFDRFYQVGGPDWYQYNGNGTGIGLALTKELVALHHGRIDVHSTIGQGTEFVIRLPINNEHIKPEEMIPYPAPPYKIMLPGEKEIQTPLLIAEEENEPEKKEKQKNNEKERILVVEDNVDMRKFLRQSLEGPFKVIEAANGHEGIKKAKAIIPDLVVCDIMMPGTNGYEVCRALKKYNHTSLIPFIFLTAKASEESMIRGLETEADDYIIKPFNSRILLTRIKTLIYQRRQFKEKIHQQILLQPDEISVSSMDTVFIKEVQDLIEKNLSDPEFNVDQLAGKLYMSRSGLYRKLHPLIGQSPVQFIRSYRLQRAVQLLKANFGNVTEVSLEVGFANVAYFTKCFKEFFHQLPSSYINE